jgi:hypothetical protein
MQIFGIEGTKGIYMRKYENFLFGSTAEVISVFAPALSYFLLRPFVLLVYVSLSNLLRELLSYL